MKKGYYIHFDARLSPGVAKKIDMQIRELGKYYEMNEINVSAKDCTSIQRITRLLPGGSIGRHYEEALEQIDSPDFIYVRRATADVAYIQFFKECKKRWPQCKILIEIFTYPYDRDEFMRLLSWPYYFKEIANRKKLVSYVDRYVTFSLDHEIFGVPTIETGNGIEVDKIKFVQKTDWNPTELNLIAVAYMQKHHGYERIIRGLHDYYSQGGERKIILHMVGDGPEKKRYLKMVNQYHLEDYVIFYPTTFGEELDKLYEYADIAISALGCYKDGVYLEGSLKSREYMAKGLPMIVGCEVNGLSKEYPYVCRFPNNGSSISIDEVLSFYDGLCEQSRGDVIHSIRKSAFEIADMSVVMKPIVEFVERHEK